MRVERRMSDGRAHESLASRLCMPEYLSTQSAEHPTRMRGLVTAHWSLDTASKTSDKWAVLSAMRNYLCRRSSTRHSPLTTAFKRRSSTLHFALATLALLLTTLHCPLPLSAQSESASVSGRVTDQTNAVVPDVEVELRNADTGVSQITKTNGDGFYSFAYAKPGKYVMSVRKQSFQTVSVTGITLNVQDNLSRNFVLQVGSSAESITVNGDQINIDTTGASVSTVVDRQFVDSVPLNGRSLQPLISLTPGVVLTPASAYDPGQFSVNGQRSDANYFTVDGVSANFGVSPAGNYTAGQAFSGSQPALNASGGTNSLVSIDAIQEFRVETSSYAPEFGRTPGGQVLIATRSGTNQFHGTVFDYFRNTVLDANDWFANSNGLPRAPEHQNDFGGTFGGPVVRSKTFFFLSYEGLRLEQPQTGLETVPNVAFRQSAPIVMQPFLNALPIPNGRDFGDGRAQFAATFAPPTTLDATSIRLDQKFGNRIVVFGRYNYAASEGTFVFKRTLNVREPSDFPVQTFTLGSTLLITSSVANDFRFNYSRADRKEVAIVGNMGGAVPVSDASLFPSPFTQQNALYFFTIGGAGGFVAGNLGGSSQRQFNVTDGLSVSRGTHQFKFGVDYRHLSPTYAPTLLTQSILFLDLNSVKSAVADFDTITGAATVGFVFQNFSLFGQDTWKINSRLTLTYGLRWEVNPPPHGVSGQPIYTVQNLNDPANLTLAPAGTPLYNTRYASVAPRVGLAAQISRRRGAEAVVRGAFGIFYDLGSGALPSGAYFPYTRTSNLSTVPFPIPAGDSMPPPFSTSIPPGGVDTMAAVQPNLAVPRTYQWNLAVEQSLGQNQSLSLTYVGAVGRDLLVQNAFHPNPNFNTVIFTTNGASSNYNALQIQYQRRLSRGLQALGFYSWSHSIDNSSSDSSAFNGGPGLDRGNSDFDIRHSFHGVLTFAIPTPRVPVFGRAIIGGWTVDATAAVQSAPPVDLNGGEEQLFPGAPLVTSRPDVVPGIPLYLYGTQCTAANGGIPCPGGKAINFIPGAVAGGCPDGSQSVGPFCNPPSTRQGNFGRNVLRGFGLTQVDLALRRQFNFTERWNLQFSAEAFNVLNHPNFANVDNCTCDSGTFGQALNMVASSFGSAGGIGFNPLYQVGGPRSIQLALKLRF